MGSDSSRDLVSQPLSPRALGGWKEAGGLGIEADGGRRLPVRSHPRSQCPAAVEPDVRGVLGGDSTGWVQRGGRGGHGGGLSPSCSVPGT